MRDKKNSPIYQLGIDEDRVRRGERGGKRGGKASEIIELVESKSIQRNGRIEKAAAA